MSGQGQQQKGGQQQYGAAPPGNPYYMNQDSLYNQGGMMSGMGGPFDSYYSQGSSTRHAFAPGMPPTTNTSGAPNPSMQNPLARGPLSGFGGGFGSTNGSNPNPLGGNLNFNGSSFGGATPQPKPFAVPNVSPFGYGQAQTNGQNYQPSAPGNVDPNSPEYAAYYYGLAPSTRAFMQAPGSQQATNAFNSYNASRNDPNQAHF